jgi:AraC-like DNA-binding protein
MAYFVLVDRHDAVAAQVTAVLRGRGHMVHVKTIEDAVWAASNDEVRVVLSALDQLPEDTRALLVRLREVRSRPPVVIIADTTYLSHARALAIGAIDYLQKPVHECDLRRLLGRWIRGSTDERIGAALRVLEARYRDHAIALTTVAGEVCISPEHLCRLFRLHTGHTFLSHLRRIRVRQAIRLLRQTPLTVKEVAGRWGSRARPTWTEVFDE